MSNPNEIGHEAFNEGQISVPLNAWDRATDDEKDGWNLVEWMEEWSKGWHEANLAAPVCTRTTNEENPKNRAGMSTSFVPLKKPGAHVGSRLVVGDIIEITEDVEGFVVIGCGTATGFQFGPFASEESAKKCGWPKPAIFRRRRFVQGGVVSPGSPSAHQLDENDCTTVLTPDQSVLHGFH